MTLTVDTDSEDYRFYKTLNEDVMLRPVNDKAGHWDIQMKDGDYVNVTGKQSLENAICIAIMTRFKELDFIPLYEEFGCRLHELVKANKSEMVRYKIELFVCEVLENMRRVQEINNVTISDSEANEYLIEFTVTSISDEIVNGSVTV